MLLIFIDAHSLWVEALCTPSVTANVVIDELRRVLQDFDS